MKNKNYQKIVLCATLLAVVCLSILFFMQFLRNVSVGADNSRMKLEVNLDKYINYNISDPDKGTLIQYNVKVGNNEEELREYIPTRESEIEIGFNQIDGKYPYSVKVIAKSTEVTNGKTEDIQENYQYDNTTGTVVIKASNENENGELINTSEPSKDAKDEYLVICYYDTYIEQPVERELNIKISTKATLLEEGRFASAEDELTGKVKENIGELTNISYNTPDIANGYIKSNIINGTNYDTVYTEKQSVLISKKESQEKIKILENNNFVKANNNNSETEIDVENKGDLVYKSTKIRKSDVTRVLGLDGEISILDNNQNLIATINKDTEFEQDGTVTINYENEPQAIIIKTSNIQNEGILNIENTKVIKSSMLEINNSKIKTVGSLIGVRNETINETEEEIEVYSKEYENKIDIKDSKTNVTLEVNNDQWTNKQQNEITFDVYTNANTINDNMLKNPKIKIELPSQVEKVILGNSSVVYANGLELQDPYLEKNEDGNLVIVANLVGEQTTYGQNNLGLITDIKISATVILKKDIEGATENIQLVYANQYTLDGSTEVEEKSKQIKIENYKEEVLNVDEQTVMSNVVDTLKTTSESLDGLKVEVVPVRGDTTLKDGDTVYEGEFIKYNIKVTNTSDKQIDNVKVVGTIPEGTVYGELEAEYNVKRGKYEYNFDDNVKEKAIDIGSILAGKSYETFYEVRVKGLDENEDKKEDNVNINGYIGDKVVTNYNIKHIIKKAEAQVFVEAEIDEGKYSLNYTIEATNINNDDLVVVLTVPESFEYNGTLDGTVPTISNNQITMKVKSGVKYRIFGNIQTTKIKNQTEESIVCLSAVASVNYNNKIYKSNENRMQYKYENIIVEMSSENEGESVKYGDEIEYQIKVTNLGGTNINENIFDSITAIELEDFLPKQIIPGQIIYENYTVEEENDTYILKKTEKTVEINSRSSFDSNERLPEIDLSLNLPEGESLIIKVKVKADIVKEKTKIENNATVFGEHISTKTSNTISHTILPYDYEDNKDPDNPDNPDNPNNPNNPDDKNEKYSISGIAWLDENEDGKRQTNEKLLDGITVMLVNTDNSNAIKAKQVTDANGSYKFSELEKGKYIIIFNYDTDTYSVTEYQKSGVSSSSNSDATTKEITLLEKQTKVGLSDVIVVNANVENIDIGLIKNKICDLKLDKYISKVTVKTNNGTKEQAYDNTKLAKVEIKSKELQGAIVVVEYKIVVTNEGELPTSVTKIVDYIPSGLTFSSELNKQWSMNGRGELETSLAGQKLEPGQSVEISLTLIKSMTVNSTGTFTNSAEISEISNSLNIKDEDSIPGNKVESEDDYSKAELIISVSTGTVVYIFIILVISIMAIGIISLNIRFGFKNITKFSLILIISLCYMYINIKDVNAYYFPENLYFEHVGEIDGKTTFYGYENYNYGNYTDYFITGHCNMNGGNYGGKYGRKYEIDEEIQEAGGSKKEIESDNISINRENSDDDVVVEYENENYRIGPLKISGDDNNQYIFSLILGNGEIIQDIEVESDGINGKIKTYYLKINQEYIGNNNITKIRCVAKRDRNLEYEHSSNFYACYKPLKMGFDDEGDGWPTWNGTKYQSIKTNSKTITWNDTYTKKDQESSPIEWEIKDGDLEVEKVDKENDNAKLQGVKFYLKRKDDGKYVKEGDVVSYESEAKDATLFETGQDGKRKIKDLRMGEYIIEEISNPYYGYTKMETSNVYVSPGMVKQFVFENTKQTGNLRIEKKDKDSQKALEGISFKIKKKNDDGKDEYVQIKVGNMWWKKAVGTVHVDNMKYVEENKATTFITDARGIIDIRNILIGKYYIEEVSVGDKYFGYELDDNYINWKVYSMINSEYTNQGSSMGKVATVEILRRDSRNTAIQPADETRRETVIFENKQKYIKLNGYAWEDKRIEDKETSPGNKEYDEKDKRLANVQVKLYSYDGRLLGTTYTDKNGNYTFGTKSMADIDGNGEIDLTDVLLIQRAIAAGNTNKYTNGLMDVNNDGKIDDDDVKIVQEYIAGNLELIDVKVTDLRDVNTSRAAYIEFKYNGLNYETVSVNLEKSNTNKAAEISAAKQSEVDTAYKKTYIDNRKKFNDSWSTIENNKKIDSNNNTQIDLTYNYNNHASSLLYGDGVYGYDGQKYPILLNDNDNIFNITARTETNVISENDNDRDSYKLLGQTQTIREILKNDIDTIENINLGVMERAQPDLALTKDIYSAKVTVNGYEHTYKYDQKFADKKQNEDQFNVDVKFGEKFGNQSFTRAIYPSDVKETQDEDFSVKVVYKITLKNESGVLYSKINSLVDYFDKRYKIGSIGTGYENGEIKDKIGYKLDASYQDTKYRKLIINCNTEINPNESNKNIYIEYTLTRSEVKDILFDKNGNQKTNIEGLENIVEVNSYSTYSDKDFTKSYAGIDSDSNPGSTVPGNKDTYEDDTDYAPGLILEVANSREITGTVFEDNAVDPTAGGVNNERLGNGIFDDGEKTISGVQVGLYKEADFEEIKDEDGKIIDMQLKSEAKPVGTTTYGGDNKDSTGKDGTFTIKDFAPGEYRIVYFWGNGKYTIEDYKSTIWTSDNKNEKDGNPNTWYRVNTDKRYSDALDNYDTRLKIDRGDTSINKMDSKTQTMVFGVELADDIDNKKTETSGIDKVTFSIENIDFGIIERPRQSIDVTKRAKSMKITLANGQVIADAKIVEKDGKLQLEQQVKGVIYTEPSDKSNPKNGQIKAEIDNELIQGATVEIKYEIKVQNNSEIDYDSERYYCYGERIGDIVKIKASGIYDYLDNTMIANDENTEWETKTIEKYNEEVSKPTVIEEYLHKYQSSSTDASGNTEMRVGYEEFTEQYVTAIKNWEITKIKEARKKRLADKTILYNADLEKEIAPGDSKQASLTASKILTNTDEIELNNDVEITEITRTTKTGRKVTPKYSSLYDRGETVTVTTPTGENRNYILITIVAISFFVILGTGIVFIKKKILK